MVEIKICSKHAVFEGKITRYGDEKFSAAPGIVAPEGAFYIFTMVKYGLLAILIISKRTSLYPWSSDVSGRFCTCASRAILV